MANIFYLMGKSSSGKDTIYQRLLQKEELALNSIVQYTTRPIRSNEEDGQEYHFVTQEQFIELKDTGRVIEYREYNTCYGIWIYATVQDDYVDINSRDYLMIGTLESYQKVKEYFGENRVIPLMLECDDGIRLERALLRERSQKQPKYEEMCRRYLADSADFSEENQKKAGISYTFFNDDLERCLEEMSAFIKSKQL